MIAIERGTVKEINQSNLRGWPVGHMCDGLGKTLEFEIKLWEYDHTLNYPKKIFGGTEFIVVYGGAIRLDLERDGDKQTEVIHSKEYIILGPNLVKLVSVVESPAYGVTVRWPSQPEFNKIVGIQN